MKLNLVSRTARGRASLGLAVGALVLAATAGDAAAGPPHSIAPREFEELLVLRRPGASKAALRAASGQLGAVELDEIPKLRVHRLRVAPGARERVKRALERRPDVLAVEENRPLAPEAIPDDPEYGSQWHLPAIKAEEAWDIVPPVSSVVIAILDTGVDSDHVDLVTQLVPGTNTFDGGGTDDVHGHGTKVAGSAAAATFNAEGVASVAWNSQIMPIRVTGSSGTAFPSTLANGLVWAADQGARVANMSFQSVVGSPTVLAAAQYFVEQGGIVFAGAGNLGTEEPYADTPWIVSVSATDSQDALASFSSWGQYIDIAAPGKSIRTTRNGGTYGGASGTSISGPVAAGVAALMLSIHPDLEAAELEHLLEISAVDLGDPGWDPEYGYGRVNAGDATYLAWAAANGAAPQCSDGIDNDGDGLIDFPEDPGCLKATQARESPRACGLGLELALLLPLVRRRWHRRARATAAG